MAAPTSELGHVASWSDFSGSMAGVPLDPTEETPELQWPNSVRVFDRMRRQDAQVGAVLLAVTLPLRRPIWSLDPRRASEEVVRHCAEDLDLPILGEEREPAERTGDRFSWPNHLRLALLSLIYGHMPFEQVYRLVGGRARLRKLAPRFPPTLSAIVPERDGGLREIRQYAMDGGKEEPIPVARLAYYCNAREGAAWQGVSILRTLYKHWLLKDRLMRVDTQMGERNGMGIPIVEAAAGTSQAQMSELSALAQSYRAGEASGGALPYGARLRLVGVEGTLPDLLAKISYHDTLVARGMLAQFLQLGTAEASGGHRALGETFVEFFAHALDALALDVSTVTTQHVVEDIVDVNWGPDEPAPAVVAHPIAAEVEVTAEQLAGLVKSGILTRDDELEAEVRRRLRLPAHTAPPSPPGLAPGLPTPTIGPVSASARRAAGRRVMAAQVGEEYDPLIAAELARLVDAGAIEAVLDAGGTEDEALDAGVGTDASGLAILLAGLWAAAFTAGAVAAAPAVAGAVPSQAVTAMLGQATGVAQGILSTLRDRVAGALATATAEGIESSALIAMLDAIGTSSDTARLIAVTETRRAAVAGAVATWAEAGVTATRWRIGSTHPCPVCLERDDTTAPEWDPLPPAHPNCECALEPA